MSHAVRVREWARRLLVRRAHDVTDTLAGRSVMVLAPHPDDETLGCAGRIQRAVATGAPVTVVVATDGARSHPVDGGDRETLRALRRSELIAACAALGVPEAGVITLDLDDGGLAESIDALVGELADVLRRVEPDDVYVTCPQEAHPDHAVCARALATAARQVGWQGRLLAYPVWLWSDWPLSRRHVNGVAALSALRTALTRHVEVVHLDAQALARKRTALACYASQTGGQALRGATVALPAVVLDRALDGTELFFRLAPPSRGAGGWS